MKITHKPILPDAIQALIPGALFVYSGSYDTLYWDPENPQEKPTEQDLLDKLVLLEANYPMVLLREERNKRLANTDWVAIKYFTKGELIPQQWAEYFQQLRDLPNISTPTLDTNGFLDLSSVQWPAEPLE
jgi:hypothetical protein